MTRRPVVAQDGGPNPAEVIAERAAELRKRVQGFVDAVRR
ncbi:hypothetical protein FHU33_4431 [Blastococcus colisei]|uniref:Uncharacterized protein n=1 Tax=Blastococcus colisei TaxID=1564162 RepID=A0A543P0X1_9ACTN|nr:hypothetical protein FHU33_4431 [Blastococcus colisei]